MANQGDGASLADEEQDPQVEYLQQLLRDNEFLQRENLLMESYLSKVDHSKVGAAVEEDTSKKKKAGKKVKAEVKKDTFQKLNDDEKNDLVSQEIELVQAEIESIKKAGDKDIDDIKTLMEEVDMRITETKKDTYEFKRDIIIGAENARSGKIMGEKMVRFMEEKLRQKDTFIEKLRLKNTTTKAQIAKLEQQLAHKEEMGEVLHLVDFDQLKIENQQYMERIEERNSELLRLKLSTSRTVQVLNNLKTSLSDMVATGQQLGVSIQTRHTDMGKFQKDLVHVVDEKGTAERTVRRLAAEQADIENPSVMDYIKLKHEVAEHEKVIVDLKRKIDILTMESARKRGLLKTVQRAAPAGGTGGLHSTKGMSPKNSMTLPGGRR